MSLQIVERKNALVVRYRNSKGGRRKSFGLALRYLNGTTVDFVLSAERTASGAWRVFEAAIDPEETEMPGEAALDFAVLRWHVFPRKERGRVLPPVAALWDVGDLTVAACLPPERVGKSAPLAVQERWFSPEWEDDPPDPERLLCWWPDPGAWEAAREMRSLLKVVPAKGVDLAYYPFSQWRLRADVRAEADEMRAFLEQTDEEVGEDPGESAELNEQIVAEMLAEEYAAYVRRVRTELAFFRKHGIPVRITWGDAGRAERFFKERGLDPSSPASWAQAASAFPEMPDFVLEECGACGPLGAVAGPAKVRAAVSFHSHWPDSPCADMIAVGLYAGSRSVAGFRCWLNPLRSGDPEVAERAADAVFEAVRSRGVQEIATIDAVLPCQ